MKNKYFIAVCLLLCSSTSFAMTKKFCDTSSPVKMANTCEPEVTLYIAGRNDAIQAVVPEILFDKTMPVISINDIGGPNSRTNVQYVFAWYGKSIASLTGGKSKRLFVVYNRRNGSGAGVSQLLAKLDGKITEANIVTVGPVVDSTGVARFNDCQDVSSNPNSISPVLNCSAHALIQADMAVSEVAPQELYKLYGTATNSIKTIKSIPLALQGFGIAVNAKFYAALQAKNVADGLLPSACASGDQTAACQPSIQRSNYASLISKQGSIKSAAGFIPGDTTVLTLDKFNDLYGVQSASNIFFANNACGVIPRFSRGIGGALDLVTPSDSTALLLVRENDFPIDVRNDLNSSTGYAIGVLPLSNLPPSGVNNASPILSGWNFVRIDSVSPNFNPDGTPSYKQRTVFSSGRYPFAMTSFAVIPVYQKKEKALLTDALIAGMKDSTLTNLFGTAYIDGVKDNLSAPMQSTVHRYKENNCSPLIN